ncbi:MAG TPA: branched-chain amino acid ABC transporter substrate-binding protein [Aggregatilineales bacterium]|nr:branched-chain amino acid ABC transporter substrate-binding protein [Aggregatilineales bacterium]
MVRRLLVVFVLLLIAALGVTAYAQDAAPSVTVTADGQVVIGLAAALSGEGLAPFGEDIQRGAELALEDRPTVTVGGVEFPVSLDPQDDQCSAEGGQAIANRFVSDASVVAIVGPMCSSACRAAAPILDEAGYSSVSPSCTAPDLSTSDFSSFNRAVVSDAFQGRVAAQFIFDVLGLTSIATIHDGSAYGEGLVNVVTASFEALGGSVVAADAVNVGDTDFRGLLEDIVAAEPELIYFGGFAAEGARLVQQLKNDVDGGEIVFMGADGIKGGEFPGLAGADAEGVYTSSSIPSDANKEAVDALLARYTEKYGIEPTGPFQVNSYDATNMILDAIEAVGVVADGTLTIDRAALSEYLRSIEGFEGLTGTLNCDGTGECSAADIGIDIYAADGSLSTVAVGSPGDDNSIVVTASEG